MCVCVCKMDIEMPDTLRAIRNMWVAICNGPLSSTYINRKTAELDK